MPSWNNKRYAEIRAMSDRNARQVKIIVALAIFALVGWLV